MKAVFSRYEVKYLRHYRDALEFKENIAAFVRQDAHVGRDGQYRVLSLYFDSRDSVCFWDKLDEILHRASLQKKEFAPELYPSA